MVCEYQTLASMWCAVTNGHFKRVSEVWNAQHVSYKLGINVASD